MTAEAWCRLKDDMIREQMQRPEIHRLLVQQVMQRLRTVPAEG
jgi:hypothetical protein